LGFETYHLFRRVRLDCATTGPMLFELMTDLPSPWATRAATSLPVQVRQTIELRLPPDVQGRHYKVQIAGTGAMRLFGIKLEVKALGKPAVTPWHWVDVPGIPDAGGWVNIPLPIQGAGDWQKVALPLPDAGDWQKMALPIPPAGEWQKMPLPIRDTPRFPSWVTLPVDSLE
jgi:hypothetical protein